MAVFILGVLLVASDFAGCVVLIATKEPKVIKTTRRLGDNKLSRNGPRVDVVTGICQKMGPRLRELPPHGQREPGGGIYTT